MWSPISGYVTCGVYIQTRGDLVISRLRAQAEVNKPEHQRREIQLTDLYHALQQAISVQNAAVEMKVDSYMYGNIYKASQHTP